MWRTHGVLCALVCSVSINVVYFSKVKCIQSAIGAESILIGTIFE